MEIRPLNDTDIDRWNCYVLHHSDGLAYHQCGWRKAIKNAYGFDSLYLMAEEDGQICGVLPMINFKLPLFEGSLVSLPYCDVGGMLTENVQTTTALKNYAMQLVRDNRVKSLDLRSGSNVEQMTSCSMHKVRMQRELPENSELLMATLKSKLRSQIKKPMRDGLISKLGGKELITEFYHVFCENMRDLGSPVHSYNWFCSILTEFGDRAKVGVVRLADGTPVAAGIILLHGDTVSIPWASSLRRYNRLNSNMLLYWSFLSFAADHGFKQFDFGRSTPSEGSYKFKQQWGAKPQPLYWYRWSPAEQSVQERHSLSLFNKRQLFATLWSRLPLASTNWLGPRIRKYISL